MYSISWLNDTIQKKSSRLVIPDQEISHLIIDSRKLLFPESSLFFAFFGKQTDGHLFIKPLYDLGVRAFIYEDPDFNIETFPEANFILVDQTIEAIQEIGRIHRSRFNLTVIGLTGSNGKTIIKEWINQLLEQEYNIVRSPGSYNSQIGVPLSVWQINQETDLAIFEAGISKKGEMAALSGIISPTLGVFTNLGDAHSLGFDSKEEKLKEKLLLFKDAESIICERDESIAFNEIKRNYPNKKVFDWSKTDKKASFYISSIEKINHSSRIQYIWKGKESDFSIPFKDPVSIRMAIFAVLSSLVAGADREQVDKGCSFLSAVPMRLETKDGLNNCLLINDSYNADLTSFTQALLFQSLQDQNRKKVLILSDFYQLQDNPEVLNRKIAELIDKQTFSRIVLVGNQIHSVQLYLQSSVNVFHFRTTSEVLKNLENLDFRNETILMKGARKFKFEQIFVKLSKRFHSTVLEINLDALSQNLMVYDSRLHQKTKKLVVIKASGYGAGSLKLARHLEKNNVDYFGVAFVDEGIELRKGGVKKPIMVFNADLSFLEEIIEYKLEPVVYSFEYLEQILNEGPEGLGIHLKLDTGLNRLGFLEESVDKLCDILAKNNQFRVFSIFSHLSATPTRKYDDFTHKQAKVFENGYNKIVKALTYAPIKHLLNSAGVINFPEYQFDMVRIGSGVHGIDTSARINSALQVVHTLKAKVTLIKEVKAGESIGYERMGIEDKARRIAIIPIGYADGLVRKAGNKRYHVSINGAKAPIVGNVNMDMSMIDITAIPNVEVGDEVEIFGANIPIQTLAKAGDTIFYEILSRISPRVKRIYIES